VFFGRAFAVSNDWAFLANQAIASRLAGDADWPAAVRNWLSGQPQDLRAWMFLADQLRIARQAAAAIDAYEQVIALDAQNLMALNNAAYLASTLARPAAVDYARRALELAPDNPAVLDTLGWVLVQNSMPAEGLTYLMRATQLLPDLAEIQYHLGVAQLESGDPAAARESLNRALAGDLPDELRAEVERLAASI
jgi:Tfp pilus assembly protein PilF